MHSKVFPRLCTQDELIKNMCRMKSIDVWQRGVDTEVFHPRCERGRAVEEHIRGQQKST